MLRIAVSVRRKPCILLVSSPFAAFENTLHFKQNNRFTVLLFLGMRLHSVWFY